MWKKWKEYRYEFETWEAGTQINSAYLDWQRERWNYGEPS
jgi:hypothetical protein